jgi:membrane protease YdiL (CAAX protease family)
MNKQGAKKYTAPKVIIHCVLFMLIMAFAELVSTLFYDFFKNYLGVGDTAAVIFFSVLQLTLSYLSAILYIKFAFKSSPADFRIKKPKTPLLWVLIAMIFPVFIWVFYLVFVPGEIVIAQMLREKMTGILINAFVSVALRAALAEELWFRAGALHFLELRFGKIAALIVSSAAFGVMHIFKFTEEGLPGVVAEAPYLVSTVIYGMFFGLIAIASDSIFISAITHFMWNFFLGGDFFSIGGNSEGVINFVTDSDSFLLTGGGDLMVAPPVLVIMLATAVLIFFVYRNRKTTGLLT